MINFRHKIHDFGRDPYVDWAIIMVVFVTIVVVTVVLGVISYLNLNTKLLEGSGTPTPSQATLDARMLEETLQKFDDREVFRRNIRQTYSGSADPSL